MKLTCHGTGSKGNCYTLNLDCGRTVLLDAGVILDNISTNLNEVDFCFISHEHKDHSIMASKLATRGVRIIEGNIYQDFSKMQFEADSDLYAKGYRCLYFVPVNHGECKCSGIIIQTINEMILYVTDFNFCKYNLSAFNFTDVIVECNYDEKLISPYIADYKFRRQINTHLGLTGTIKFLRGLTLDKVKHIYLIHFSEGVGDRLTAAAEIVCKFHKQVGCCRQRGGIDWYGGSQMDKT